jgi:hypothetical protein
MVNLHQSNVFWLRIWGISVGDRRGSRLAASVLLLGVPIIVVVGKSIAHNGRFAPIPEELACVARLNDLRRSARRACRNFANQGATISISNRGGSCEVFVPASLIVRTVWVWAGILQGCAA